jgi:DNA mismatch repair protein MSH2
VLYDEDDQPGFPTSGVVLRISRLDGHRVHQHNGKLVTIFKASRVTGVWFTIPSIDDLGARWKVLKDRYDATELELVRLIVSSFQEQYQSILASVIRQAGELDVLMAFALASNQHGFARAGLSESVEGDHVAIEIIAPFNPFIRDKRNTQEWSIRLDQSHRFLLLEGEEVAEDAPLLHLVGTIAVLNQIGCFVPCASARLPLFDAILLRGGAYDQQLYGFSTFMTEMKEVTLILENMTSKSLVLIDDLCRGTASSEFRRDATTCSCVY